MGSKRDEDNRPVSNEIQSSFFGSPAETTVSLKTLVTWNISKALENNPHIDLKESLRETQKLWETSHDIKALVSTNAYYLSCALLAWQQLGHREADSLYNFVEQSQSNDGSHVTKSSSETVNYAIDYPQCSHTKGEVRSSCVALKNEVGAIPATESNGSPKMDVSSAVGLVIKLPQTVMNMSSSTRSAVYQVKACCAGKSSKPLTAPPPQRPIRAEITNCATNDNEELSCMGVEIEKLRERALKLARRGTRRTEQLERAEMAWHDLESGYQRRLQRAKEKEDDLQKEMSNKLNERDNYKNSTQPLISALKQATVVAESKRESLSQLNEESCGCAATKQKLLKKNAEADAKLVEIQLKVSQFDRDLALKEEQEKRKQRSCSNAVEVAQLLVHEVGHAQRTEMNAVRDQVKKVSDELLTEDAICVALQDRVADKMKKKEEMIKKLDLCQADHNGRKEEFASELKKMKVCIAGLEDEMAACLCKHPVDKSVEAKRTPSLVAQCRCPPEFVEATCSCASIRARLMSTLLRDWFGGLTLEIENISSDMSCDLLKCLDDKHNWDRPSPIKKEVGAFFSRVLLKELEIAIATTIEKNFVQWVGTCHMIEPEVSSAPCRDSKPGKTGKNCTEREVEMMAHKMAQKLFQERTSELVTEAEDILREEKLICDCASLNEAAVYRCSIHTNPVKKSNKRNNNYNENNNMRKFGGAVEMRQRIPLTNVKKEERGIPLLAHTAQPTDRNKRNQQIEKKETHKTVGRITNNKNNNKVSKAVVVKRNPYRSINIDKNAQSKENINVTDPVLKYPEQYAVNICLCDHKNDVMDCKCREEIDKPNQEELQLYDESTLSPSNSIQSVYFGFNNSYKKLVTSKIHINLPQNISAVNIKNNKNDAITSVHEIDFKENLGETCALADTENKIVQIPKCNSVEHEISTIKYTDDDTVNKNDYSVAIGTEEILPLLNTLKPRTLSEENCIECLGVVLTDVISAPSFKRVAILKNAGNDIILLNRRNNFKTERVIPNNKVGNPEETIVGEKNLAPLSTKTLFDSKINFLGVTTNKVNTIIGNSDTDNSDTELFNSYYDYSHTQRSNKTRDILIAENKHFSRSKSIDVQESCRSNNHESSEGCVCCSHSRANHPTDLEINTFQLLEEHLKRQLEDFKLSVCKRSCIENTDETILVNDTLHKVKRLILQNASVVTNNYIENNKFSSATWNRAHSLLQEYLKTKIKHIRSSCNSLDYGSGKNMVNHVLNDISRLIEDDLQQLTKICKCNNTTSLHMPETKEKECKTIPCNEEYINDISKTVHYKLSQIKVQHSVVSKLCDASTICGEYENEQPVQTLVEVISVSERQDDNNS